MRAYFQLLDSSEVHIHFHTALYRLHCSTIATGLPYIKTFLPDLARLNRDSQDMRHTWMLHYHFHIRLAEPRT
jgi:hypothetical protein